MQMVSGAEYEAMLRPHHVNNNFHPDVSVYAAAGWDVFANLTGAVVLHIMIKRDTARSG